MKSRLDERGFLVDGAFFLPGGSAACAAEARSTRYRAKIVSCFPPEGRDILLQARSCFLGISLETRGFTPLKVDAMLQWIAQRAQKCAILVGDSIHRKTLQIRLGVSEMEALDLALDLG